MVAPRDGIEGSDVEPLDDVPAPVLDDDAGNVPFEGGEGLAGDAAVDPMDDVPASIPEELLGETFGPLATIRDELATPPGETVSLAALQQATLRLSRSMLAFGGVVVLAVVGNALLTLRPTQGPPPAPAPTPVSSPDLRDLDGLLELARADLDRGLFQDVVVQLEALAVRPEQLTREQRFRLFSTLSLAHRRLGAREVAAAWGQRATDVLVETESVPGWLSDGDRARADGDLEGARRAYARILARGDGLAADQADLLPIARVRLADCYRLQAELDPATHPLPDVPADLGLPREDRP